MVYIRHTWIVISSSIHLKMFCFVFVCVCVYVCVSSRVHTHTRLGNGVSSFFSVRFFDLSFWVLLSALLTCFVSFFPFYFLSAIQYLQMKWPLLDVQPGGLQSRQALKDARSPSPAHIVVSNTHILLPSAFTTERNENFHVSIFKHFSPINNCFERNNTSVFVGIFPLITQAHTQWDFFICVLSFV